MKISLGFFVCSLLLHVSESKVSWLNQEDEPQCAIYSRFDYELKVVQKLGAYENLFEDQKKINDELRTELKNIKGGAKENDSNIAFYALVNGSFYNIRSDQTIIFGNAVTNIGQAYDSDTGVFTAPKAGIYQFTATLLTAHDKEIWCHIMLNGDVMANINERGTGSRHGSGSQVVILHIKEGDRIYVKNWKRTSALWGDGYCSFAGFLIQ